MTARVISRWLRLPSWGRRNTSRILRMGNLLNAMRASEKSPMGATVTPRTTL